MKRIAITVLTAAATLLSAAAQASAAPQTPAAGGAARYEAGGPAPAGGPAGAPYEPSDYRWIGDFDTRRACEEAGEDGRGRRWSSYLCSPQARQQPVWYSLWVK